MIKFIKFSIVGGVNTILSIVCFNIFLSFNIHYLIANTISYALGTINSYVLNTIWSFNSSYSVDKLMKFIGGNIICLCINLFILEVVVNNIGINLVYGQLLTTGIGVLISFGMTKVIVFK